MFKTDELARIAERAMAVVGTLDGLTIDEAQLVLKQAGAAIMGAQRVQFQSMAPSDAMRSIEASIYG